jgi:hypothetical protein
MRKITEHRAADLMRGGSCLAQMHTRTGTEWFLIPGGRVEDGVVKALLARSDVIAGSDGLFPGLDGLDQTYRFRSLA